MLNLKIIARSEQELRWHFQFEDSYSTVDTYVYEKGESFEISMPTQSGCPVACTFCESGEKFNRHLNYDDFNSQIDLIIPFLKEKNPDLDISTINIITNGSGDPMLNWSNVERFIQMIQKKYDCYVTIQTIGINMPDVMRRILHMGERNPKLLLNFSLMKCTDKERFEFIQNKNISVFKVAELVRWGRDFLNITKRKPIYTYIVAGNEEEDEINILTKHFSDFYLEFISMTKDKEERDHKIKEMITKISSKK